MGKAIKPVTLWFIGYSSTRSSYMYSGSGHYTRSAAIRNHERDCGRPWAELKRRGDFTVKCLVTPEAKP